MKVPAVALVAMVFALPCYGQAYKCKMPDGKTMISESPCREGGTVRSVERENISESQRRSSTEWLHREAARMRDDERREVRAQQEAQRQEAQRQAAAAEAQQKQQEAYERQRMLMEMEALKRQQAEAIEAARRAEQAANNAAASGGGPVNCRQKMSGNIVCF